MNIEQKERTLFVNPQRVIIVLAVMGVVIVLLSLLGVHMRYFPDAYQVHNNAQANFLQDFSIEMDFNLKHNIANYFGMLFMALAAYLSFLNVKFKKKSEKFIWGAAAFLIFLLSINNLADLLERVDVYFQIEIGPKSYYPVSEIAAAILFVLILIGLWQRLEGQTKWLFLAFALTYFGGVIGKQFTHAAGKDLAPALAMVLEQFLEYGGAILLVYGLLTHLASSLYEIPVSISG